MTIKLSIILTVLTFSSAFGQTQKISCYCPKTQFAGTKTDTSFHFSNGKTIVLCGYKNPDSNPTTFSEFVLAVCGQDTIIDFWSAVHDCRLKIWKDTLLIEELKNLPTGKNFDFQETVWTTEKIYFSGQKTNRKLEVNRRISKYNLEEIKQVLKTFERAKPGIDDSKMEIANKLFLATISNDKTSRLYFKEFKTKFGPLDGDFAEEYNELNSMLKQWDKKE